jgi:hypothetical protein
MKVSVEKPGSPADILEHHGVKGQKWGVQRAITKSGAFKRWSKVSEANVQRHFARKSARTARKKEAARSAAAAKPSQKGIAVGRSSREFRAQHPTAKLQAKAIRTARVEAKQREKAIRKEKDSVEKARLLRDHRNHPGTAIALRMTRGEKVVTALSIGLFRKQLPATTAVAAGLAVGGASERRRIERTQRKGGFK